MGKIGDAKESAVGFLLNAEEKERKLIALKVSRQPGPLRCPIRARARYPVTWKVRYSFARSPIDGRVI